jgi:hypothetical protein
LIRVEVQRTVSAASRIAKVRRLGREHALASKSSRERRTGIAERERFDIEVLDRVERRLRQGQQHLGRCTQGLDYAADIDRPVTTCRPVEEDDARHGCWRPLS